MTWQGLPAIIARSFVRPTAESRLPTPRASPRRVASSNPHRLMLLGVVKPVFARKARVELAGDVALEAADGFGFGLAFGAAPLEIATSRGIVGEAGDHDAPEGAVGLTVAAAAESMPLLFAARRIEWRGSTESGGGSVGVGPPGVFTGGGRPRARGGGGRPHNPPPRGGPAG